MRPPTGTPTTKTYPVDRFRLPCLPRTITLPPVEKCNDDQLLDLAAHTLKHGGSDLLSSVSHIEALCSLIQRQDLALTKLSNERDAAISQLEVQQGIGARSWEAWQQTKLELSAEQDESKRLRQLLAHRDTELAAAATLSLKFQQVTLRITGRTYDDLQVELKDEDEALAELEHPRARRFRPARTRRPEEFDTSDTVVLELPLPAGAP